MFFFFNDTATTEIYTLSLHDALPILYVMNVVCLMLSHESEMESVTKQLRDAVSHANQEMEETEKAKAEWSEERDHLERAVAGLTEEKQLQIGRAHV